jgi:uncharacterized protein (TIGR02680 family)
MGAPTSGRWRPGRAGILNVYQYEDETLHFADGRLLLRGVNGSGKSTAMNMMLPFLLEADTRRIDAAGEQTGVLTSWMLADNEETQRTGYLWLEFQRPDVEAPGGIAFHTVGCGIRANRSTNRTTPWWFSTPRRPRIEFALTSNKVPLAIDALRAELGSDAVFTTPTEYRAEVSRRFFGGADPGGYLRLLHQVRNPRVGDRIDTDLPTRLREALPPVSEDAVADAAQPLEDLEDHRRNVTALERTDRALGTVLETYRNYARRKLRDAAGTADTAVTAARSAAQARGRLRTAADSADLEVTRLAAAIERQDSALRQVSAQLDGVLASSEYQEATALDVRRQLVEAKEEQATTAANDLVAAERRMATTLATVTSTRSRIDDDLAALASDLKLATDYARRAGAELPLPAPPTLRTRAIGTVDGPETDADPLGGITVASATDVVRRRRQHVAEVVGQVGDAEKARDSAAQASTAADTADGTAEVAGGAAAVARSRAEEVAANHRAAMASWTNEWSAHVAAVPAATPAGTPGWLPTPTLPDPEPAGMRAMAAALVAAARATADGGAQTVEPAIAHATLRTERAADLVNHVTEELDRVLAATELPLSRPSWQRAEPADAELFAALVDFAPSLSDADRVGLEAACEAAGLLTATVRRDGTLVAANGELLLVADQIAGPHLGAVLTPVPDAGIDTATIASALAAVGLGAGSAAPLWVAPDGRFGAGPLRGRHRKATVEHIGAGAREAARRRRIAELEADLARAKKERGAEEAVRARLAKWRASIATLVTAIPSTEHVDAAVVSADATTADARRAAQAAAAARAAAVAAERAAEQMWALAETRAAEHGLPVTAGELAQVDAELVDASEVLRRVPDRLVAARRSLRDWGDAVEKWETETAEQLRIAEIAETSRGEATDARVAFTAQEAALGDSPQRLAVQVADLRKRKSGHGTDLRASQGDHLTAVAEAASIRGKLSGADADTHRAEEDCLSQQRTLQAVLAVDGLLAAATDGSLPLDLPATIDGTARLAAAVREEVSAPSRQVDENALNQSLLQIRDALGAGWDAGTRRAGDGTPVAIEVSGPYGRRALSEATVQVAADLRRARGLLTAQQDQALRNLLHGRVAREVARTLFDAGELVRTMNAILSSVTTSQGIGVRLEWRTRGDLDHATATALKLLAKDPDARTEAEDAAVRTAVSGLVEEARAADSEISYRDVIAGVLDYRSWHDLKIYLRRPGRPDELLRRRTKLSEGEKKLVTYLPMAAAASASAEAHDPHRVGAPRLILLDDAFAKVSADNHERLFGLLVELDLDFIVTSERLFGTHASVPALSIIEVLRDPDLRTIALVHYHWDGRRRTERRSS